MMMLISVLLVSEVIEGMREKVEGVFSKCGGGVKKWNALGIYIEVKMKEFEDDEDESSTIAGGD